MPETWIDDHTGDETLARPDFRTDLRAQLAKEWVQPTAARATATGRRTPWKAIGWSVAAAAAVAGTVVVLTRDDTHRIVNTPSTEVTTDTTVPTVTRADLVDVTWAIASVDGVDYSAVQVPRFTLSEDGSLRGSDGCNDIGTPPSGWALDGNTMTIGSQMDSTAVDCGRAGVWPFAPGGTSTLALDASTTHLTIRGNASYVAVRLDDSTKVSAADVVGAYTSTDGTARLSVGADGTTTFTVGGTTEDVAAPAFHVIDGVLYVDVGEERGLVQFPAEPTPAPAVLVVPATGGRNVTPEVVVTLDGATADTVRVAMLPDRFVVLDVTASFRFSGVVHSYDRAGNPLPDTQLAVVPSDLAGLVLGGLDGTLYVETFPEVANTQTTKALTLDGDTWREVDSYFVEDNNDASYSVDGTGLLLADQLVIPAPTAVDTATVRYESVDERSFRIVRQNVDGTDVRWTVQPQFDDLGIPSTPLLFGDGALYWGNEGGTNGDPYLAVLRDSDPSEILRLDGWQLDQSDGPTAMLTRVHDGRVEIGTLAAATLPVTSPDDPNEFSVIPDTSATGARTVLHRAEVGSQPDQLGRETCSECDPGRPWSPLLTDRGVVIVPDTVNARWVIVKDGAITTVPLTVSIVGQPLLVGETVYVPQTPAGGTDVRLGTYSLTYLLEYDPSLQPSESIDIADEAFTQLTLDGDVILANGRPAVTGVAPAYSGATTTYAFNENPNALTTTYGGRSYHWTLPAGWSGAAIGSLTDGSVVFSAFDGTTEAIIRVLPDGSSATAVIPNSSDGFNSNGTVSTMGYVRLEFVDGTYEVARYALPQPNTWALNPVNGAVAGFGLGPVLADEVVAAISVDHGVPEVDTGWAPLIDPLDPTSVDGCPYGRTDRIVRWGDLTLRFWQRDLGGTVLWSWSVGDLGAAAYPSQADPGRPLGSTPSGLWLDNGIHLGSTLAEVQAAWPGFRLGDPQPDGSATGIVNNTVGVVNINMKDGVVIGFGVTASFC